MTLPAADPFFTPLVSILTDMVLALRVLFSSTDLRGGGSSSSSSSRAVCACLVQGHHAAGSGGEQSHQVQSIHMPPDPPEGKGPASRG